MPAKVRPVKLICAKIALAALLTASAAIAAPVPLPRARPAQAPPPASEGAPGLGEEAKEAEAPPPPSACRLRLTSELAVAPSLPPITGPGDCVAPDVVRLEAVLLADGSRIGITPPATLRCGMAEAVVAWVREEAAPRALTQGAALRAIENFDSFDCRGRNRIPGAQTSEHGKANALDVRALRLVNGKVIEPTDPLVPEDFREGLRTSVCARFTTVLGPGSDGYHENHVHLDLAERRNGYRLCHWELRQPQEPVVLGPELAGTSVPLPRPRPAPEDPLKLRGSKL
jgi:hypothetical protein